MVFDSLWLNTGTIYIIKIGQSVCGQLCDWSTCSAGLANMCAQGLRAAWASHSSFGLFKLITGSELVFRRLFSAEKDRACKHLSDEMLARLSVWSDVQAICTQSS